MLTTKDKTTTYPSQSERRRFERRVTSERREMFRFEPGNPNRRDNAADRRKMGRMWKNQYVH